MVSTDDLAQILWIEARGELGRADKITKHHRELTALGAGRPEPPGTFHGTLGATLSPPRASSSRKAAMAASSFRRLPIEVTPRPIKSSAVSSGSTLASTSLS